MNVKLSQEHLAIFMQYINAYDSVVLDDTQRLTDEDMDQLDPDDLKEMDI